MNPTASLAPPRLAHPDKLFIDGQWLDARRGGRIDVISAHSEQVIARVAEATEEDVDLAVLAARRAFDSGPWPRLSPAERAEYLRRLSAALAPRLPELAQAWAEQIGALASVSPFVVGAGHYWFDYYAQLAGQFEFEASHPPMDGRGRALVVREAVGVVAAIAPWNNPFGIMAGKLAPALLAGCTVIMKPAPETPIEAYIIAEAAEQIGLPAGVLNLVTTHREAADHLVCNPGVDKVSFTGSVAAGQRIGSVCGGRIARYTLELGGKSAAIVLDDYDLGQAAKVLASTISMSCGQVCATLSRVIVSRHRQDELLQALQAEMQAIRVGDPFDPSVQMGPLAMARQRSRVEEYIAIGQAEGARLISGGSRPADLPRGYYIEPTLFGGVDRNMRIAQEEIFGPVLSVLPCDDEEDAIRIANDSPFGLYGAVFTDDAERAYRVARGVRTGTVSQNAFRFDPSLPFGGFKLSGVGREGGVHGLAGYTELKSILLL
ncbi:aldehyde dehydrogenase [Pseudomonas kilonensis]|uniref:aldehyde dehydrogenase n=1 Tax=Pseudomonas kilonensis TaxID=132476 RepID=UPI00069F7C33|nr:aldehyde dehydrogenase [Pseudomonas kilonensis]